MPDLVAPVKMGDRGSRVQGLQLRLIALGYSVGPAGADGVFGALTRSAVLRFQRVVNASRQQSALPEAGTADQATWFALMSPDAPRAVGGDELARETGALPRANRKAKTNGVPRAPIDLRDVPLWKKALIFAGVGTAVAIGIYLLYRAGRDAGGFGTLSPAVRAIVEGTADDPPEGVAASDDAAPHCKPPSERRFLDAKVVNRREITAGTEAT